MMKKIIIIFYMILINIATFSQELVIFNINNSQFPIMNASFLAMKNKDSAYTDISINNFLITEMGLKRKIINVSCPEGELPTKISTVITIDVSGSMRGGRLFNAIESSKLWVNMMNLPSSECGIVTFSNGSSILQDITSDKDILINKLNSINAIGGTNYEAALWNTKTGALGMVNRGKYKKVIVFLTDGLATLNSYPDVIQECIKNEIIFYVVTLDMLCPKQLKLVAESTGGRWIENVNSKDQLKSIFVSILNEVQKMNPCIISWESENFCSNPNQTSSSVNGIMNFNYENVKLSKDFSFAVDDKLMKSLVVTPANINFGFVPIGEKKDISVELYAQKGDFDIFSIVSTNQNFTINPTGGSIKQGNKMKFTLTYTPTDTTYTFGSIEFRDPNCVTSLMASGGKFNAKPKIKTIKLSHPNGGEVFAVDSDTIVTWSGITQDDIVNLEYSTDKGYSWSIVAKAVKNLKYDWKNIPNTPSNQCLMKVSQISDEEIYPIFSLGEGKTYSVKYNSTGTIVAFGGTNGITLRDPISGRALLKIANNTGIVQSLAFSPDGKMIASAGNGYVRVWNVENGNIEKKFPYNNDFYTVEFSKNGEYLCFAGNDKAIYFYNTGDWTLNSKLDKLALSVRDISFSPDGNCYAYTDNSTNITIREFPSHNIRKVIQYNKAISKVEFNSENNLIVTEKFIYDLDNIKIIHEYDANSMSFAGADSIVILFNNQISLYKISDWNLENSVTQSLNGKSEMDYSAKINQFSIGTDNFQSFMYNFNNKQIIRNTSDYHFADKVATASPNLNYIALNNNNLLTLWLIPADTIAKTFYYNKSAIKSIKWSADSKFLASGSGEGMLYVFDMNLLDTVYSGKSNHNSKKSIVWDSQGKYLAYTYEKEIVVVEMKYPFPKQVYKFTAYNHLNTKPIAIDWSRDGKYIVATYDNNNIAVWQIDKFDEPIKLITSYSRIYDNVMFSIDGKQIVVGSLNHLIDFDSGISREIKFGNEPSIWSFNNKYIIQGNNNNVDYYYRLGNLKETFSVHNGNILEVSPIENTNYFLTASADGTVKIWEPESNILQDDISDMEWKIVAPKILVKNVDMGIIPVISYKDSIVTGFIKNIENVTARIDSVVFGKGDNANFEIVSGNQTTYLKPNEFLEIEFRFIADEIRKFSCDVEIYYNNKKESVKIFGEGVEESIKILPSIIDFDSVFVNEFRDSIVNAVIVNVGSVPVSILKSEFGVQGFDNFLFSSGINDSTFTIQPGDSVNTQLRFSPKTYGYKSGVLQFHHNRPGSPANVQLFGIGVAKGPKISSSSSIKFDLVCEESKIDSVHIFNIGNNSMTINSIELLETSNDFSIIGDTKNIIIDTGDYYTLKIMFAPKSAGQKNAFLKINNNSSNDTAYIFQIVGNKDFISFAVDKNIFNLGYLCPNTKRNYSLTIKNSGSLLNHYKISTPSFIKSEIDNFNLDKNDELILNFEFLGLNLKQLIDDYIIITDSICNISVKIKIKGIISNSEFSLNEVVMNSLIGQTAKSEIILKNETKTEISILPDNIILPAEISLDLSVFPILLKSEEKVSIPISFTPMTELIGEFYAKFISSPCQFSDSAKIRVSSSSVYCLLEVGNGIAFAGEIINIPVYLKNKKNFDKLNIKFVDFDLKFNSTLLEPLVNFESQIQNGIRTIMFENVPINENDELLLNIPFKVGLGDAEKTELIIVAPNVKDFQVYFDLKNGTFDLLGICEDGGKRLIGFDTLQSGILSISPNPANEKASIVVGYIEDANTKLSIIDISGKEIFVLFYGIAKHGIYQYDINTKLLNSGLHFIKLETPTIQEIKQIIIHK